MKRVVVPISLPELKEGQNGEVVCEIADPGDIVDCLISIKPKVGGIVASNQAGKPNFEFIPTMLVLIDPDNPPKKRTFYLVQPSFMLESEGTLVYRGRFLFPDGNMLIVFEEIGLERRTC